MLIYSPFHDARKWQVQGLRTRDGHVAQHLAQQLHDDDILIADRPTCIAEMLRLQGRWYPTGKRVAGGVAWRVTVGPTGSPTVDVLVPELGFRRGSYHRWLMDAFVGERYNDRIRRGVETGSSRLNDVLWICHPFAAGLIDRWPGRRVVFDAFDNFAVHPELPQSVRMEVHHQYARLCRDAEHIAVNSVALQAYLWAQFRRETTVVPNGADPALFMGVAPMPMPFERPIIGYAGKLGRRIDVALLLQLAKSLAEGTIVLAGQVLSKSWMSPIASEPRIRHIGDLHYRNLPAFLAAADVCIVPHRVGEGENHGDATKIYEYLAAGKPTVTTAIEGTQKFAGRAVITDDERSFVEAVLTLLRGQHLSAARLLPDETWSARTETLRTLFGVGAGSTDPS